MIVCWVEYLDSWFRKNLSVPDIDYFWVVDVNNYILALIVG